MIERQRIRLKDGQASEERAYFITNQALGGQVGLYLFEAVGKHWSVEIDNYVRDVTLGEDHIRCKDSNRMRAVACLINVGLNLMRKQNTDNNFIALREELNFDRQKAINCLSNN